MRGHRPAMRLHRHGKPDLTRLAEGETSACGGKQVRLRTKDEQQPQTERGERQKSAARHDIRRKHTSDDADDERPVQQVGASQICGAAQHPCGGGPLHGQLSGAGLTPHPERCDGERRDQGVWHPKAHSQDRESEKHGKAAPIRQPCQARASVVRPAQPAKRAKDQHDHDAQRDEKQRVGRRRHQELAIERGRSNGTDRQQIRG